MSYIQTVKITDDMSNISVVIANIANAIKNITGWTIFEGTNILQIGEFNHLNLEFTYDSGYIYNIYSSSKNYYPDASNPSNDVEVSSKGKSSLNYSNIDDKLYLNYCKSASGNTIGIGLCCTGSLATNPVPNIDFIIAKDDKEDVSAILLSNNSSKTEIICNGYWCYADKTGLLSYVMTGSKVVSTSVCKMPNFLNGCMFTELYKILSCPLASSELYATIIDIDGKKYQGVNPYSEGKSAMAILAG